MKPAVTYYDSDTNSYQKPFNVRYEFENKTYEITLYASCFGNAEDALIAIKRNGVVFSELIEEE